MRKLISAVHSHERRCSRLRFEQRGRVSRRIACPESEACEIQPANRCAGAAGALRSAADEQRAGGGVRRVVIQRRRHVHNFLAGGSPHRHGAVRLPASYLLRARPHTARARRPRRSGGARAPLPKSSAAETRLAGERKRSPIQRNVIESAPHPWDGAAPSTAYERRRGRRRRLGSYSSAAAAERFRAAAAQHTSHRHHDRNSPIDHAGTRPPRRTPLEREPL